MQDAQPINRKRKSTTPIDWELVEREYKAAELTLRQIAFKHECGHTAIIKRAKQYNWQRRINDEHVQAKSVELANQASALHDIPRWAEQRSAVKALETEQQEDESAILLARVRLKHRVAIERARVLSMGLMEELEQQTFQPGAFEHMVDLLKSSGSITEEDIDQMMRFMRGAMSTAGRIDSAKKLADALTKVVDLERTAYGMDANPEKGVENAVAAFLGGLKRSALPVVAQVPYIDMDADDAD